MTTAVQTLPRETTPPTLVPTSPRADTFPPGSKHIPIRRASTNRKSKLVRRLSKRIRRVIDNKILDERHTDETLIKNMPPQSPGKPVQKSTSLNRENKNHNVSMRRRRESKNHTISKCHFDLRDFDNYSRTDIPELAEHFRKCNDPAHILPRKKQDHLSFSSRPPFVKVKKEVVPDESYAEFDHTECPEIQQIIDLLVSRAEHYNTCTRASSALDSEMRELVLGARSNMRWYILYRVWDVIKATSASINWSDLLSMLLT